MFGVTMRTKKEASHGIGQDATKAARIVAEEHVAHEQTEAREQEHQGHHGSR